MKTNKNEELGKDQCKKNFVGKNKKRRVYTIE